MLRRNFLKSLTLSAGGLFVADDVLKLLIEPRRKYWAGANFSAENWSTWYAHDAATMLYGELRYEGATGQSWNRWRVGAGEWSEWKRVLPDSDPAKTAPA